VLVLDVAIWSCVRAECRWQKLFLWQLVTLVEVSFYVCWVMALVQLLFSFVCCYFTTPNLAFLVLVRIHRDFSKFHFSFFKNKKNIVHIITSKYNQIKYVIKYNNNKGA